MSAHTADSGEHPVVVAIRTCTPPGGDHRDRLIAAMGELLAEQGYAYTIVDADDLPATDA